ncbi:MAG: alpha/beta fold hydrolase [Actinomycetota bacterium]
MSDFQMRARMHGFARRMHLTVTGSGASVVLGNGFGTELSIWDRVLPWLEARFRVVRFDWPFAPGEFDAEHCRSLDGFADDLLAVVVAADAVPCLYVGHSVAGMAGVAAAGIRPDFFRQLVLLSASPRYLSEDGYVGGFSRDDVAGVLARMGEDFVRWAENYSPLVVGLPGTRPEVEEFSRGLLAMRPDIAICLMRTILESDMRLRLDGMTVPTTVVQPNHDHAVPMTVGAYLQAHLPAGRLEVIDAGGHLPHLTEPRQVVEVLERAIGSLARR